MRPSNISEGSAGSVCQGKGRQDGRLCRFGPQLILLCLLQIVWFQVAGLEPQELEFRRRLQMGGSWPKRGSSSDKGSKHRVSGTPGPHMDVFEASTMQPLSAKRGRKWAMAKRMEARSPTMLPSSRYHRFKHVLGQDVRTSWMA